MDAPLGRLSPPAHALPAPQVVHTAGLGDGTQLCMLLVTVQSGKAVVAQAKDQGFASIANHISFQRGERIGHGQTWNESLSREARRGTRSGTCSKGTAMQDEGLDLDAAFRLSIGTDPLVLGDMCDFAWSTRS